MHARVTHLLIATYGLLISWAICINSFQEQAYAPGVPHTIHEASGNEAQRGGQENSVPKADIKNDQNGAYPPGVPQTVYKENVEQASTGSSNKVTRKPKIYVTVQDVEDDDEDDYEDEEEWEEGNHHEIESDSHKMPSNDLTADKLELNHDNHGSVNRKKTYDKHELEHLQHHLDGLTLDTSNMTDQEISFHYFKVHDADNNQKLDGLELIKFFMHSHAEEANSEKIFSDMELIDNVENILERSDLDNDGYIDYAEFKRTLEEEEHEEWREIKE